MQDEEIMCIALLKATALNIMTPADLKNARNLFNLSEKDSFEEGMLELKKTISFIILIERNNIQDYLGLLKFRTVSSHLYNILMSYFTQLWELFNIEKTAISKETLKSYQQIQTPMEKLSKSFNGLKMDDHREHNPHAPFDRFNNYFSSFGGSHKDNRLNFQTQDLPPYLFPYQNYMGADPFHSFSGLSGGTDLYNNIVLPNRASSEPFHISNGENAGISSQDNAKDSVLYKKEQISQKEMDSSMQIEQPRGCFCGDSEDSTLIKCTMCEKHFHLRCWQSQYKVDAVCPFCRVIKMHTYNKTVGQPIFQRCSLTDQQFFRSKVIKLKEKELSILAEAINKVESDQQCWVQLRILKVSKDSQEQKKGFKSGFSISVNELKKMQQRKYLELKFKNIGEGDCIIFVLVCTAPKSLAQFQAEFECKNSKIIENITFVKDWLTSKGRQQYKVNSLHPITNTRVFKPARGIRCDHLQCEDLAFVYEQGTKKDGRIICSYCKKEYSVYEPFLVDQYLERLIKKNIAHQISIKLSEVQVEERIEIQNQPLQ